LSAAKKKKGSGFWDGFDIKDSVCPQQWQGQYAGTASCKSCWEGEDCGWTCDLIDGTKAGVDLQGYVDVAFGTGYCARNPSTDPCLGWQVFGDGCSDCDASSESGSAKGSAFLKTADLQTGTRANLTDDYCRGATITAELWTQVCKHQVCHNDIAEADPGNNDHSGNCWHCWCSGVGVQEGRQPIGDDYKDKVFNEFKCCPVNDGKPDPCGGWKLQEPSWIEPQCP